MKKNLIRTITRNRPQWIPYRYDGCLTSLSLPIDTRIREGGIDDWGVNWVSSKTDEGSYPDEVPVIAIEHADSLKIPDTDFDQVTADLKKQIDQHKDEDTLLIVRSETLLFERVKFLLGTTEFMMATATHPREINHLFDNVTDYQIQLTRAIMESGVAGVRFTDDWGMQCTMQINPDHWRTLMKDRLQAIYGVVKEYDGFVFQHSCGHIEEIVPDLIEIGVDVLDPCQPSSNDVFGWKRKYGDQLSFMGGLDTQSYLAFGSPEEIKFKVKQFLDIMGKGGGYIAAPSHTITLPEENMLAMEEAIYEVNGQLTNAAMSSVSLVVSA